MSIQPLCYRTRASKAIWAGTSQEILLLFPNPTQLTPRKRGLVSQVQVLWLTPEVWSSQWNHRVAFIGMQEVGQVTTQSDVMKVIISTDKLVICLQNTCAPLCLMTITIFIAFTRDGLLITALNPSHTSYCKLPEGKSWLQQIFSKGHNVPAQVMNFPHGETAAHEFGAWCVSTVARTAPVWKISSVFYPPIQFYYATVHVFLQHMIARVRTVKLWCFEIVFSDGSHSWRYLGKTQYLPTCISASLMVVKNNEACLKAHPNSSYLYL